jgi:hypothetical protein
MNHLKELLLSNIENTACWRAGKAEEYPEDAVRNNNCSEALIGILYPHVEALPDDHALWQVMEKCCDGSIDLYSVGEYESYMIRTFGFYLSPQRECVDSKIIPIRGRSVCQDILNSDPEEFVAELTSLYENALKEGEKLCE